MLRALELPRLRQGRAHFPELCCLTPAEIVAALTKETA
jgi:hypothetical protein